MRARAGEPEAELLLVFQAADFPADNPAAEEIRAPTLISEASIFPICSRGLAVDARPAPVPGAGVSKISFRVCSAADVAARLVTNRSRGRISSIRSMFPSGRRFAAESCA